MKIQKVHLIIEPNIDAFHLTRMSCQVETNKGVFSHSIVEVDDDFVALFDNIFDDMKETIREYALNKTKEPNPNENSNNRKAAKTNG